MFHSFFVRLAYARLLVEIDEMRRTRDADLRSAISSLKAVENGRSR